MLQFPPLVGSIADPKNVGYLTQPAQSPLALVIMVTF